MRVLIQKSEIELKSIQHADDLTVSVKNELSLLETIRTVDIFWNHAGSKINISKTDVCYLDPWRDSLKIYMI